MSDATSFALALLRLDGVGRVTATRLLRHFPTHADLLRYPREQILARLKGTPNAADLVALLLDREAMQPHLAEAEAHRDALAARRITLLTMHHPAWPTGLADLPRPRRPVLLHVFGPLDALTRPGVAFFARPPLTEAAFELAQDLLAHLHPLTIAPVGGIQHGFDVVLHKRAAAPPAQPSVAVTHCGLAKLPSPMRPVAQATVRAGGVLCAPFPMDHGPFEHDDRDRALVMAALARVSIFIEPHAETPEALALDWALAAGRPVFAIPAEDHPLPDRIHRLRTEVDFDWVRAAVTEVK